MSSGTVVVDTENQLNINRDISIIFLGNNLYDIETYTNNSGGDLTLPAGTLMGRVSGTGVLKPVAAASVDGSQYPIGILTETVTVLNTASAQVSIGVKGDVAEEKIVFDGAETFSTVVDGRQLRDRIASDTQGINLVTTLDLTGFDNQ